MKEIKVSYVEMDRQRETEGETAVRDSEATWQRRI